LELKEYNAENLESYTAYAGT